MVAPMVAAAGVSGLASLLGGVFGSKSAKKAAKAQLAAQQQQMQFIRDGQEKAAGILSPGANYQPAQTQLMALLGLNGGQAQQNAIGAAQNAPDFQFRLGQGVEARNRSAAARGTALSGRTQVDLEKFGQDLASTEFGNHFNRLFNLYGTQLGTAGQLAGGYTGQASALSNIAGQMGQTRADGITNGANQWINALQGMSNAAGYGFGEHSAAKERNRSSFRMY